MNFNPQFHNSSSSQFRNTTQPSRQIPKGQFQNRPSTIRPNPNHHIDKSNLPKTNPQRNSTTPNHIQHSRAHHLNLINSENCSECFSEQPEYYLVGNFHLNQNIIKNSLKTISSTTNNPLYRLKTLSWVFTRPKGRETPLQSFRTNNASPRFPSEYVESAGELRPKHEFFE